MIWNRYVCTKSATSALKVLKCLKWKKHIVGDGVAGVGGCDVGSPKWPKDGWVLSPAVIVARDFQGVHFYPTVNDVICFYSKQLKCFRINISISWFRTYVYATDIRNELNESLVLYWINMKINSFWNYHDYMFMQLHVCT